MGVSHRLRGLCVCLFVTTDRDAAAAVQSLVVKLRGGSFAYPHEIQGKDVWQRRDGWRAVSKGAHCCALARCGVRLGSGGAI
jgi:hypothetical protein